MRSFARRHLWLVPTLVVSAGIFVLIEGLAREESSRWLSTTLLAALVGVMTVGVAWYRAKGAYMASRVIVPASVLAFLVPFSWGVVLHRLDDTATSFVFVDGAGAGRDYLLFVADNVAKGALIDLLQSYDIHLWSKEPRKTFLVGTLNFAIRSWTTFFVIWSAVQLWQYQSGRVGWRSIIDGWRYRFARWWHR